MTGHPFLALPVQLACLWAAARCGGWLARRLGQPAVIGELSGGIALGPSLLGHPSSGLIGGFLAPTPALQTAADLGLILFMLLTGFELDLRRVKTIGRPALTASLTGLVLPFVCGFGLGCYAPENLLAAPQNRLIFSLYMGTAISISAIPVIARILMDLELFHKDLGAAIISAAVIDDTAGWILLSAISGLAAGQAQGFGGLARPAAMVAVFVAGVVFVLRPVSCALFRRLEALPGRRLLEWALMAALAAACSWATWAMDINAVFGAFAAGVLLNQVPGLSARHGARLRRLVLPVMAPIFFACAGLRVDFLGLGGWAMPVLFVATACAAKILGCAFGARFGGMGWRDAWSLGLGMNARGAMELAVAAVGLRLGVLNQASYSIVVLIALVTTFMTPPLLRRIARTS